MKKSKITVKPNQPARLWPNVCEAIADYIAIQPLVNGKPISINRAINEMIVKAEISAAVQAERERCARIAKSAAVRHGLTRNEIETGDRVAAHIAKEIEAAK